MLSSRNRKLKRFSRFIAFFVIVFSGCYYRLQKIYESAKDYTSSDDFMENSPLVPPFIKEIHKQRKSIDLRKQLLGVRLPPEDENELRYRLKKQIQAEDLNNPIISPAINMTSASGNQGSQTSINQQISNQQLMQQQQLQIIKFKNPYTQALKRQAFFKFQHLKYLFK